MVIVHFLMVELRGMWCCVRDSDVFKGGGIISASRTVLIFLLVIIFYGVGVQHLTMQLTTFQ
jgi:hypothetical protein